MRHFFLLDFIERRIIRALAASFLISTSSISQLSLAQQVYKWVDSNGKVHYGDKRDAPKVSQEVKIKSTINTTNAPRKPSAEDIAESAEARAMNERILRAMPNMPPKPQISVPDMPAMPKAEKWPAYKFVMPGKRGLNENVLALGEATLQNCVSLAVKMHDLGFSKEEEPVRKEYLRTCPGVRVECLSYRKSPEKNICEPKAVGSEKSITVFRTEP